ncbi:ArsR/SmtB family transcription factor [Streptomyces sp. NPDC050560]|uniref:ArsR/SmtB family transcription factor n=1 Tax=Streptomyces sp. NPDC050560 TaxID=3365630 RepID=UPI0037A695CC
MEEVSTVDEHGHPTPAEMELGRVLTALSDPLRRKVVSELAAEPPDTERTCTSFGLPVSKSTCTHHFRVLRESGLTEDLDYGNRRGVRLRRQEIDERFPGLLDLVTREPEPAQGRAAAGRA